MKKLISIVLVVVLCLATLAGCGSSTVNDDSKPGTSAGTNGKTTFGLTPFKDKQTLRIGFFTGSPLSYPYLFAEKLGYFKELNIDVEFVPFTNGPAMLEASAEWDIGSMGLGGLSTSLKKGFKIIDINDYEENLALFARKDSPLAKDPKNPDNWKGNLDLSKRNNCPGNTC
jgi:ABC-type nitrate/sulfonate/bicarbonate transport system substrate-binding protein